MFDITSRPLVHVYRGNEIESIHSGTIVVVNDKGNIVSQIGEAQRKIFARSSMKLFQVIPAIEAGIMENYHLSAKDISLFCASHNGEDIHTETVQTNLQKANLSLDSLQCGTHAPYHIPTYEKLLRENDTISAAHSNCSGKHTGMLLTAKLLGEDVATYHLFEHPVQQRILQTISDVCEYPTEQIDLGIDGCGVPVHRLPMYNIALGYSNLVSNEKYNGMRTKAIQTVVESINEAPEMIAGTDRFCTDLLRVTKNTLIAKVGAEGVYCIGHIEKKLGIVIKIDDGNSRASYPVAMEVLRQLDLVTATQYEQLQSYAQPVIRNVRNEVVGLIKPVFSLTYEEEESHGVSNY